MAILNVNPTRMELSNLKKKLNTSRRGHKLLKDKRDELMRQFMDLVRENQRLRVKVEAALKNANSHMAIAKSVMSNAEINTALALPKQEVHLSVSEKNVMSVMIPEFNIQFKTDDMSDMFSYGFAYTSGDLDDAVTALSQVLPDLIRLAEVEKSCQLMAAEIEKTRRRVNALEYVMIPNTQEAIRYINMKLDENDRATTIRLMKVKDMLLKEAIEERREADAAAVQAFQASGETPEGV